MVKSTNKRRGYYYTRGRKVTEEANNESLGTYYTYTYLCLSIYIYFCHRMMNYNFIIDIY